MDNETTLKLLCCLYWYSFGERRCLSVYKSKKNQAPIKKEENVTSLQFSEQTKLVLQDLFTRYPPGEEQSELSLISTGSGSKRQGNQDNSFARPSMSEAEIAKRLHALAAKVEETPHLKKVPIVFVFWWNSVSFCYLILSTDFSFYLLL